MQLRQDTANAILATIPNAIIVTDDTGLIEHFNLAAGPLFQQFEEDVLGLELKVLIPDLTVFDEKNNIKRKGMFLLCETTLKGLRADDLSFPIEIAVGEITLSGVNHWVFSIRDITQRLKIEAEATASKEQLVRAERLTALGGMVAGVAHEINTPLGIGITAASHLESVTKTLKSNYEGGKLKKSSLTQYFDDFNEAIQILNANLSRAADLIRSFKLVSVDQSSEQQRTFDLELYIEEVLLSLKPKLKQSHVTLTLDCEKGLIINSYPGAIAQIISNFILNSLIHAFSQEQKGQILIKAFKQNNHFVLNYEDNGKGIPKENIGRIFDPFFTTRRGDGGSGLGLHVVHNLITEKLKGKITYRSEPNQGVYFTIELPTKLV